MAGYRGICSRNLWITANLDRKNLWITANLDIKNLWISAIFDRKKFVDYRKISYFFIDFQLLVCRFILRR